jgi:hypothetical protein
MFGTESKTTESTLKRLKQIKILNNLLLPVSFFTPAKANHTVNENIDSTGRGVSMTTKMGVLLVQYETVQVKKCVVTNLPKTTAEKRN